MSATDSDNSIDWLASDDEDDNESEREPDCTGRTSQTQGPDEALSPSSPPHRGLSENNSSCCSSSEVKQRDSNWSEVSKASSRGWSSSCTETWDSDASGLCHTERLVRSNGENAPQALKRPHSSVTEQHKERQLISNESEKDRLFTRKVRTCV